MREAAGIDARADAAPDEDHGPRMTGRVASDDVVPAEPALDELEVEARFEQTDTLSHRTVGALSWMFVNAGGQIALQITVLAVLARLVSPQQFGLVAAMVIVITFSEIISDCGIGAALIQRSRLTDDDIRTGFTLTVLLSVAVWVCVALGAPGDCPRSFGCPRSRRSYASAASRS